MASTKIFTLFAGVNSAGKSTLFSVDTAADLGVRLNTDEIVKERGWDWRDASAQLRAGRELLRRQKECLAMGGHGVSGETIDRRFDISKDNLKKIFPLCDTVNIYDNSGDGLALVASYIDGAWVRSGFPCCRAEELISGL